MFVALDADNNRVYADTVGKGTSCFCPACNEPLRLRKGSKIRPHFAHLPNTECYYGIDKDYKSEWHIRMQDYFPRENQEVRFEDENTGERHIADVYLPAANMVLEFQHSPISEEEFMSRTLFHINHDRRIVWLFDESTPNPQKGNLGRFKPDDLRIINGAYESLYRSRTYKWLRNPRRFLSIVPAKVWLTNALSICVYTGVEGDVFHRIFEKRHDFENVVFSLNNIAMSESMDVEDFFRFESYWQEHDPWKEKCEILKIRYNTFLAQQEALQRTMLPQLHSQAILRYRYARRRRGRF